MNSKSKGISFNEVRGKIPACRSVSRMPFHSQAGADHYAATVIRDDGASFILVEANDWNEILFHERQADR